VLKSGAELDCQTAVRDDHKSDHRYQPMLFRARKCKALLRPATFARGP